MGLGCQAASLWQKELPAGMVMGAGGSEKAAWRMRTSASGMPKFRGRK